MKIIKQVPISELNNQVIWATVFIKTTEGNTGITSDCINITYEDFREQFKKFPYVIDNIKEVIKVTEETFISMEFSVMNPLQFFNCNLKRIVL